MTRDRIVTWAVGLFMGLMSATVAYMVASIFPLEVARYESAEVLTTSVRPGDYARYRVTYSKFRDCAGDAMVVLHPTIGGGVIISQQILGNRPPGTWTISRQAQIPPDARPGSHGLQEVLAYDCGLLGSIVRSPLMPIEITPQ